MSERLSTGCRGLDEQLEGGIEIGTSTLAYGEPGSGKTSLAIQLSKKVISSGKKSIFIDTEGVSFERIKQIFGDTDTSNLIILEVSDNNIEISTLQELLNNWGCTIKDIEYRILHTN